MHLRFTLSILALLTAVLSAGEKAPEPLAIKAVKTWSDLAKQPAVSLNRNATARFGVQAVRAPRYGSVMIYCMTEAFDPEDEGDAHDDDKFGPFKLSVLHPGKLEKSAETLKKNVRHAPGKRDYGRLVFAQVVALGEIGTHTVDVKNANGAIVASVKIECVDAPFHPWSTLVEPDEEEEQDDNDEGGRIPVRSLQTAPGHASLPKLRGGAPILYWLASGVRGPRKFDETDPLPILPESVAHDSAGLTPAQKTQAERAVAGLGSDDFNTRSSASAALLALGPSAHGLLNQSARQTADAETLTRLRVIIAQIDGPFHIELDSLNLLVNSKLPFEGIHFEDRFLMRWWVNGRLVSPNKELEELRLSAQGGVEACKRARFKLKFDHAALGAKAGDKIGLQMLFCPDGTQGAGPRIEEKTVEEIEQKKEDESVEEYPDRFPALSNRIEFIAP